MLPYYPIAPVPNCGIGPVGVLCSQERGADVTMRADEPVLVEVDQRRRVSLGKLVEEGHSRYLATVESDGSIVLRPAVVMTETEAALLQNRDLVDRIIAQRSDTAAYVRRPK